MAWFRMHDATLDNPKVQRLPDGLFKAWVNLMCLANRQAERGSLPGWADIAYGLRRSEEECKEMVQTLQAAQLIDEVDGVLRMHDWADHQFMSDNATSTERVRKHRAKRHGNGSTKRRRNVSGNASEQSRAEDQAPSGLDPALPEKPRVVAPSAPAPGGARSGVSPLHLTGANTIWSLRLQCHKPSDPWNPDWGPSPDSDQDNPKLDADQRRQWRRHHGLPADWRKVAA